MVVFDVHGQIDNDTAYLSFLSSSGLKEHRVSATKIAALLREYEVETAFPVSCESASSLQQEFQYIRLYPLFCLALRGFSSYLDIESGEDWSDRTSQIFMVHFCQRGAQFYTSSAARIDIKPDASRIFKLP